MRTPETDVNAKDDWAPEYRGFDIPDLARRYKLRPAYWYEQIALGNLEAVKLGKRTIILVPALRKFLASLPAATSNYVRPHYRRQGDPLAAIEAAKPKRRHKPRSPPRLPRSVTKPAHAL